MYASANVVLSLRELTCSLLVPLPCFSLWPHDPHFSPKYDEMADGGRVAGLFLENCMAIVERRFSKLKDVRDASLDSGFFIPYVVYIDVPISDE